MWFKHMDAPGRKSPWKQDSPGRGSQPPSSATCWPLKGSSVSFHPTSTGAVLV